MTLAFHLSAYWLLVPLFLLLAWWVTPRADEYGGYIPSLAPLFRLAAAACIFLLVLCALVTIHLWLK